MLLGTTVIAVALYVIIEVCYYFFPHINIPWIVTSCFYLPCDCLFVVTAITTYTIIFYKYTTSVRRRPTTVASASSQKINEKPNALDVLKSSKFYVSALLILTFMLLVVLVDICYVVLYQNNNGVVSRRQVGLIRICYTTSFLFNALVYIFLQSHLRRLLGGLVTRFRRLGRSSVTSHVNGHLEMSPAVVTKCNHRTTRK